MEDKGKMNQEEEDILSFNPGSPSFLYPFFQSDHSAYHPSTNIPPTRLTPVIVAKDKEQGKDDIKKEEEIEQDEKSKDFELISMLWGFVPVWYHGEDPTKHG